MKTTLKILGLLVAFSAFAQDTTVKIKGVGPRGSTATATIIHKSSLVTFSIGSGTIDGAGLVALPISINSKTGQLPAGVQFELSWLSADVASVTLSLGPAATAAQKTITCAAQPTSPPSQKCIVVGLNQNGITDGVIAFANVQTSLTSQATTATALFGAVSADIAGSLITSTIAPGGGVISMPALLATLVCAQPDIWAGLTVSCSASLNKPAPTGGAAIALSSDSALVTTPASLQIAAGAKAGTFSITGM